jgi:hypothetical protein
MLTIIFTCSFVEFGEHFISWLKNVGVVNEGVSI